MKRLAFASIVLLGVTVSCMPTATPQPQAALATATVQTPTVTPTLTQTPTATPTITPSPTSTPTATITPTPTRASTPTITPTPTQTPIPKFVWTSGFENGFADWDEGGPGKQQGGVTEIVSDPTSSGKGNVMRSTIGGGTKPPIEEQPGALVFRLYPSTYQTFKPAPCEVKNDVWLSKELIETATKGRNILVVGPDIFDKWPRDGGTWSSALQAVLYGEQSISRSKTYLRLKSHQETGSPILAPLESSAPEFTPEQWHTVTIYFESNRDVRLYQDGHLVSKTVLPMHNRLGMVGGHPGLYAWNYYKSSPPMKGFMLVDNWEIRCW